jgi:hypothetical protein
LYLVPGGGQFILYQALQQDKLEDLGLFSLHLRYVDRWSFAEAEAAEFILTSVSAALATQSSSRLALAALAALANHQPLTDC